MKKTPWFSGACRPVRIGEYEVFRGDVCEGYPKATRLKWTGDYWLHTKHSGLGAITDCYAHMSAKNKWRGLAKKP